MRMVSLQPRLGAPENMSRDFIRFLRRFGEIVHYVRGVLLVMLLLLSTCAVVFVLADGMPLGKSVYLTFITALTIGYGDIVPTTVAGRVTSVVGGIIGVIFIGLTVAIATRALAQSYEEKQREEGRPPST
ncbi:MAG: potassium channel family protein [Pseudolabrys sp.]